MTTKDMPRIAIGKRMKFLNNVGKQITTLDGKAVDREIRLTPKKVKE